MIKQSLTSFVSKKLTLVTFGAVLTAFLFNGCAAIGNSWMSNETFAKRSSFALNASSPNNIQISNRHITPILGYEFIGFFGYDIDYVATINKKAHQCRVMTIFGVLTTEATCSGMGYYEYNR